MTDTHERTLRDAAAASSSSTTRRSIDGCSTRLLTAIGHESLEAGDGATALDLLRDPATRPVDVDPARHRHARDGWLRDTRGPQGRPALRDLPVIVISGVDELESVVRCIQMGAADYLPKTVDPEILRARIDASLAPEAAARPGTRDHGAAAPARRDHRSPAVGARPLPVAAGRRPRLERGRRGDAGRPPPRDHRDVLRPAQFHGLLRNAPNPRRSSGSCAPTTRVMGPLIVAHEGTLEHFAGDGFMTFFNDPVLQADHAARAVGPGRGDARALRGAVGGLAPARPRARDRHRDRHRVRDAGPDRVRGSVRLRRGRARDHPRRKTQRRSGTRARS